MISMKSIEKAILQEKYLDIEEKDKKYKISREFLKEEDISELLTVLTYKGVKIFEA